MTDPYTPTTEEDYEAMVADARTLLRDSEAGGRVERNNMIGALADAVEPA